MTHEKSDSILPLVDRRSFIKGGIAAGAFLALGDPEIFAETKIPTPDVWIFHGKNKTELMTKAFEIIKANGGFGAGVKNLTLKVNAAWARTPAEGANTDPELVAQFLKLAKADGISVVMPEYSCDPAKTSFVRSGIYEAAKRNGVDMIDLGSNKSSFKKVQIPEGKSLKEAEVSEYFINKPVVNMPVAKDHECSKLSIAMKNWMGIVKDRGYWHNNDLHQCIADFCTYMKGTWTIIDATRTMMSNGPKGPGKMKYPDLLIVSKNQVSADAYASTLFVKDPKEIEYLKIASKMGLGIIETEKMNVIKTEV